MARTNSEDLSTRALMRRYFRLHRWLWRRNWWLHDPHTTVWDTKTATFKSRISIYNRKLDSLNYCCKLLKERGWAVPHGS